QRPDCRGDRERHGAELVEATPLPLHPSIRSGRIALLILLVAERCRECLSGFDSSTGDVQLAACADGEIVAAAGSKSNGVAVHDRTGAGRFYDGELLPTSQSPAVA